MLMVVFHSMVYDQTKEIMLMMICDVRDNDADNRMMIMIILITIVILIMTKVYGMMMALQQ